MRIRQFSILVLAAAPMACLAQTSLTVGNAPGYPGATVSVPITLKQPAGGAVAAQFDVAFSPSKVSASAPVATARLANHTIKSREVAPGLRRTLIYSPNNSSITGTNGAIATMAFTVSSQESASSGPLFPDNVIIAQPDGAALSPVVVSPGTIFVRPVNILPDGHVQFFLYATEGQRYAIQATTNLINWVNISTNTASSSFMDLIDVDPIRHPYRFYRWQLLPP